MITIRLRENGPIVIEGDEAAIVDWNGVPYEIARRPIALCRCGGSGKKPFCDGTHKTNGFCGSQAAVALAAPPPLPTAPPPPGPPPSGPPPSGSSPELADEREQR